MAKLENLFKAYKYLCAYNYKTQILLKIKKTVTF